MKESTNNIVANIQRRQEVAQQRAKLKAEAQELKAEQGAINRAFIAEQLDNFIAELKKFKSGYTIYQQSSPFTKFVNRNGLPINAEHRRAMNLFNEAKENLAKVFADGLLNNENSERQKIIEWAGVKNIKDMERYFK